MPLGWSDFTSSHCVVLCMKKARWMTTRFSAKSQRCSLIRACMRAEQNFWIESILITEYVERLRALHSQQVYSDFKNPCHVLLKSYELLFCVSQRCTALLSRITQILLGKKFLGFEPGTLSPCIDFQLAAESKSSASCCVLSISTKCWWYHIWKCRIPDTRPNLPKL